MSEEEDFPKVYRRVRVLNTFKYSAFNLMPYRSRIIISIIVYLGINKALHKFQIRYTFRVVSLQYLRLTLSVYAYMLKHQLITQ